MPSLFKNRYKPEKTANHSSSAVESVTDGGNVQVVYGDQKYVGEQGDNTDVVAYQEASGAPVETHSPLGYNVGPVTIVFLNLSKMVGTGIDAPISMPLCTLIDSRNILYAYVKCGLSGIKQANKRA